MQAIDIREVLRRSGVGIEEAAAKIYPNLKNPYKALNRVMNGIGALNADEIVTLSKITGFEVSLLFNPKIWSIESTASDDRQVLRMKSSDFVAELDLQTYVTTAVKIGTSNVKSFTVYAGLPLREYLCKLTEFVNNN